MFKYLENKGYANVWGKHEAKKKKKNAFPQTCTKFPPLLFILKKRFLQYWERAEKQER